MTNHFNFKTEASLVVQWLRVYLAMQVHQFDPWSGKIPHALEQLSLCTTANKPALQSLRATTTKPVCLECVLCKRRRYHNKKPIRCNQRQPLLNVTREKPTHGNENPMEPNNFFVLSFKIICKTESTETSRLPQMFFHTLETHPGEETSINSASPIYGIEEGKRAFPLRLAFQGATHRQRA